MTRATRPGTAVNQPGQGSARRSATAAVAAGAFLVAVLVAGCASNNHTATQPLGAPGTTTASASGAPSPTGAATPPQGTVVLDEKSNGRTITVHAGTPVEIILHSSYWSAAVSSPAGVLVRTRGTTMTRDGHCAPGVGCSTQHNWFIASGTGDATVEAHRTICGEAMRCVPEQHITIRIVVT
jgi:hypothetical protein